MDAKTLAADIRKAVRAATKTAGDPLHGLRISVRTEYASMMSAIDITVLDMDDAELIVPEDDREPGQGWATQRGQAISNRLHELAAPALEEADDRHSFCSITFDGLLAPSPRDLDIEDAEDAELEERNAAELAELAADDLAPELCPGCTEVMGTCDCDGEDYDHSRAKEDARNEVAGITSVAPSCPNGHGPMRGRATITESAQTADALGIWHTCTTPGCGASFIAPSRVLVHALGSALGAHLTPAPEPVTFGTRRGALAAVR